MEKRMAKLKTYLDKSELVKLISKSYNLPMAKHKLRTSLSTRLFAYFVGEVETLDYRQYCSYVEYVGSLLNVTVQYSAMTSGQHCIHLT